MLHYSSPCISLYLKTQHNKTEWSQAFFSHIFQFLCQYLMHMSFWHLRHTHTNGHTHTLQEVFLFSQQVTFNSWWLCGHMLINLSWLNNTEFFHIWLHPSTLFFIISFSKSFQTQPFIFRINHFSIAALIQQYHNSIKDHRNKNMFLWTWKLCFQNFNWLIKINIVSIIISKYPLINTFT